MWGLGNQPQYDWKTTYLTLLKFDSTSCPLVFVGDWFQDTLVAYGY